MRHTREHLPITGTSLRKRNMEKSFLHRLEAGKGDKGSKMFCQDKGQENRSIPAKVSKPLSLRTTGREGSGKEGPGEVKIQ